MQDKVKLTPFQDVWNIHLSGLSCGWCLNGKLVESFPPTYVCNVGWEIANFRRNPTQICSEWHGNETASTSMMTSGYIRSNLGWLIDSISRIHCISCSARRNSPGFQPEPKYTSPFCDTANSTATCPLLDLAMASSIIQPSNSTLKLTPNLLSSSDML